MTRTYALKRLLEHGPMRLAEIVECTGWKYRQVEHTLNELVACRLVERRKEYGFWSRYEAVMPRGERLSRTTAALTVANEMGS